MFLGDGWEDLGNLFVVCFSTVNINFLLAKDATSTFFFLFGSFSMGYLVWLKIKIKEMR